MSFTKTKDILSKISDILNSSPNDPDAIQINKNINNVLNNHKFEINICVNDKINILKKIEQELESFVNKDKSYNKQLGKSLTELKTNLDNIYEQCKQTASYTQKKQNGKSGAQKKQNKKPDAQKNVLIRKKNIDVLNMQKNNLKKILSFMALQPIQL